MLALAITLGSPLALLSLLALFIPLAIHLLSKARPRVVPFAHIAFITLKTSPRLRQLRLSQRLLLMLRILLLLTASMILAQVFWQPSTAPVDSYVLVTEDWLQQANDAQRHQLSLHTSNSHWVLIGADNQNISAKQITHRFGTEQSVPMLNMWGKVTEATAGLSKDAQVTVFTTNRLSQFIGQPSPTPFPVKWQIQELPKTSQGQELVLEIKVLYDASSAETVAYLRGALTAINTHPALTVNARFLKSQSVLNDSQQLQDSDLVIALSSQSLHPNAQNLITHTQLGDVTQVDFPLTLVRLLLGADENNAWLTTARLSATQITQGGLDPAARAQAWGHTDSDKSLKAFPLHIWLVLALVLLFLVERVISEWPSAQVSKGKPRGDG